MHSVNSIKVKHYFQKKPALNGLAFLVSEGLEPKVRVLGARGALPVAEKATRASGSGLYFQGGFDRRRKYRAPQQDNGTKKSQPVGAGF